jgi:hypothetical protein
LSIAADLAAPFLAVPGVVAIRFSSPSAVAVNGALLPVVVVAALAFGYVGLRMSRRTRPSGFRAPETFAREATGQDDSVLEVVLRDSADSDDVAAIRDAIAASPQIRVYTFMAPDSFLALMHAPEHVTPVARRLARLPGVARSGPPAAPHV